MTAKSRAKKTFTVVEPPEKRCETCSHIIDRLGWYFCGIIFHPNEEYVDDIEEICYSFCSEWVGKDKDDG